MAKQPVRTYNFSNNQWESIASGTISDGTIEYGVDTITNISEQLADAAQNITSLNVNKASKDEVNALATDKANVTDLTATNVVVAQKADTAAVETMIAAVASGSPKGAYATLAALQAAYPSGTTGIYVVSADGKWYYWNGSAWTAGAVYQATGLDATLRQLITDSYSFVIANQVSNGDFSNGTTGWTATGAALTQSSNTLSITSNGSTSAPRAAQQTSLPYVNERKIAVRFRAKVDNNACQEIDARLVATGMSTRIIPLILSPAANTWYEGTVILQAVSGGSGNFSIQLAHLYADSAASSGKVMQVQYVSVIDLTGTFGAGSEPTSAVFEQFITAYPHKWINGSKDSLDGKVSLLTAQSVSTTNDLHDKTVLPLHWELGTIDTSGNPGTTNIRIRTSKTWLTAGTTIRLKNKIDYQYAVHTYTTDGTWVSGTGYMTADTVLAASTYYIILMKRNDDAALTSIITETAAHLIAFGTNSVLAAVVAPTDTITTNPKDANVKAVLHRGYNTSAPEDTLPAYTLAKKNGFDIVECDVRFTSDGVAVLLHDLTVDRTSNGTGAVASLTFDYVRSLDFGSWKSAEYTGTQIPTFQEFILHCKKQNLCAVIDLKVDAHITDLVTTVRRLGMVDNVIWTAWSAILTQIKTVEPRAHMQLQVNGTITQARIDEAVALKTGQNKVGIYADKTYLTDELSNLVVDNGLELGIFTVNSSADVLSLSEKGASYIATDYLNIAEILSA